jgi:hypothetical protein
MCAGISCRCINGVYSKGRGCVGCRIESHNGEPFISLLQMCYDGVDRLDLYLQYIRSQWYINRIMLMFFALGAKTCYNKTL